jgi:putative transposase
VSRICSQLAEEFSAWSTHSLAEVELDYLYLDGTCFRYHPGARAEPVLVAYGITTTGAPVFLGLAPAASEGHDPWIDFLQALADRGLRSPRTVDMHVRNVLTKLGCRSRTEATRTAVELGLLESQL